MAGLATKAAISNTMSTIEKQFDLLTASDKNKEKEETTPLTKKEKKEIEKNEKKLAEQKAKREKQHQDLQSKRAELRNAMRAKYGLRSNERDDELIAQVDQEEESPALKLDDKSAQQSVPAWGEPSPIISEAMGQPNKGGKFTYPGSTNPFEDDGENPDTLLDKEGDDSDEFLEKQEKEKELETKKKELAKIEKKLEKKRIKQEEKEKRQQEKLETKARKERQKQTYTDWKTRKDSQKSIVTDHERKSALYKKYGVQSSLSTASSSPDDMSPATDTQSIDRKLEGGEAGQDKDCSVM